MLGEDGLYCDVCEKKMKRYVTLPARNRDMASYIYDGKKHYSWGWYEGHAKCLKDMKRPANTIFGHRSFGRCVI